MKELLEKLKIISDKHREIRKEKGENFNLFNVMRMRNDEVKTHSAIIAELLNPKGTHGFGNQFLLLFIDTIQKLRKSVEENKENELYTLLENQEGLNNTKVSIEQFIGPIIEEQTEGGRLDILLKEDNFQICIENKIFASDQPYQLRRYHNYLNKAKTDNTLLLYLTLYGTPPSESSICNSEQDMVNGNIWKENTNDLLTEGKDYHCLSYREDILIWLEKCYPLTINQPILRESLRQYIILVKSLTGNTMEVKEREELVSLLGQNNMILEAKKIVDNWKHIRWHTEFDFWSCLETNLGKTIIPEFQKFSADTLTSAIHGTKNKNRNYGLSYQIATSKDYQICIYIERGPAQLFYGLMIKNSKDEWIGKGHEVFDKLKEATKNISPSENPHPDIWLVRKDVKEVVNFEEFANANTLKLCNKEHLEETIKSIVEQVSAFEGEIKEVIEDIHGITLCKTKHVETQLV